MLICLRRQQKNGPICCALAIQKEYPDRVLASSLSLARIWLLQPFWESRQFLKCLEGAGVSLLCCLCCIVEYLGLNLNLAVAPDSSCLLIQTLKSPGSWQAGGSRGLVCLHLTSGCPSSSHCMHLCSKPERVEALSSQRRKKFFKRLCAFYTSGRCVLVAWG